MQSLKRISWFFCCCAFVYALLVAPWPGVRSTYHACFRAGGNFLFGAVGTGAAKFAPLSSPGKDSDTLVTLRKRRPPYPEADMRISSIRVGYWPTVFLIALAVATPIPWTRRWRALVLGLICVHAFIALRIGLFLVDAFSNDDMLAVYSFSGWFKFALHSTSLVLFRSPAVHYIGPLFIWLAVTFRRGDFETIMGHAPSNKPAKSKSRRNRRKS